MALARFKQHRGSSNAVVLSWAGLKEQRLAMHKYKLLSGFQRLSVRSHSWPPSRSCRASRHVTVVVAMLDSPTPRDYHWLSCKDKLLCSLAFGDWGCARARGLRAL